jgi:7,8-dihydropterin-6-yl-methyl-4-(beta-D-ribofuranosyl)aminobenzene 5'-phosphate synthase
MKISDFVYSTGELPGPPNEQSLLIDSQKGAVLITGCAHPGIVNIVLKAKDIIKKETIYLALGGFHQPPLSVVKELRKIGVKKVAPSHCTGDSVREIFAEEYQEDFIEFGVGQVIKIEKNSTSRLRF